MVIALSEAVDLHYLFLRGTTTFSELVDVERAEDFRHAIAQLDPGPAYSRRDFSGFNVGTVSWDNVVVWMKSRK